MIPTKPGIYWYKNEPAKVLKQCDELWVDRFVPNGLSFVAGTDPADWGTEVVPPDVEDNPRSDNATD